MSKKDFSIQSWTHNDLLSYALNHVTTHTSQKWAEIFIESLLEASEKNEEVSQRSCRLVGVILVTIYFFVRFGRRFLLHYLFFRFLMRFLWRRNVSLLLIC